jgi:hypothetical protein
VPLVKIYTGPRFRGADETPYCVLLQEIIPNRLSSPQGILKVGDIECIFQKSSHLNDVDILIDIEAVKYKDRARNQNERARLILEDLAKAMPDYKSAVWLKLIPNAIWVSTTD